jgi:hypothetical protein
MKERGLLFLRSMWRLIETSTYLQKFSRICQHLRKFVYQKDFFTTQWFFWFQGRMVNRVRMLFSRFCKIYLCRYYKASLQWWLALKSLQRLQQTFQRVMQDFPRTFLRRGSHRPIFTEYKLHWQFEATKIGNSNFSRRFLGKWKVSALQKLEMLGRFKDNQNIFC